MRAGAGNLGTDHIRPHESHVHFPALNVQSMVQTPPMDADDDYENHSEHENQRGTITNETVADRRSKGGVHSDSNKDQNNCSATGGRVGGDEQATISGVESLKARFTSSDFQVQKNINPDD